MPSRSRHGRLEVTRDAQTLVDSHCADRFRAVGWDTLDRWLRWRRQRTVEHHLTAYSSPSSPTSLEQQFVAVVKQTQPSVAQIQTDQGLGSGVLFDANGDIVTNAHVVSGAEQHAGDARRRPPVSGATRRLLHTRRPGGRLDRRGHALKPARFADSSKVEVGDIVLAAGNPLGPAEQHHRRDRERASVATSAKDRASSSPTRSRPAPRSTPATAAERSSTSRLR